MSFSFRYIFSQLLLPLLILMPTSSMALEEIDAVAIIVNDEVITNQQIDIRFADFKRQLKLQGKALPSDKLLKKQVLERMVLDSIQLQLAKSQGIYVDDLSLNKALTNIAKMLI